MGLKKIVNGSQCFFTKGGGIISLCNRMSIDKMMRCRLKFFGCGLGGTDVHLAKKLTGVGRDDMRGKMSCEDNSHPGFSHRSWTGNDYEFPAILHGEANLAPLLLLGRFSLSFAPENHTIDD